MDDNFPILSPPPKDKKDRFPLMHPFPKKKGEFTNQRWRFCSHKKALTTSFCCAIREPQSSKQRIYLTNKDPNSVPSSMDFSGFVTFDIHWASWICRFISLVKFDEFSAIASSNILFCNPVFLFFFWDSITQMLDLWLCPINP